MAEGGGQLTEEQIHILEADNKNVEPIKYSTEPPITFKDRDREQWAQIVSEGKPAENAQTEIPPADDNINEIVTPQAKETVAPELNTFVRFADDASPVFGYKQNPDKKAQSIWANDMSTRRTTLDSINETGVQFKIDKQAPVGAYIEFYGKYYIVTKARTTADADKFGKDSIFVRIVAPEDTQKAVRSLDQQSAEGLTIWTPETVDKLKKGEVNSQKQAEPADQKQDQPHQFESKILARAAAALTEENK